MLCGPPVQGGLAEVWFGFGGENWGRHSIIGLPCRRVHVLRGHTLVIEELGEVIETRTLADPLADWTA